MLARFHNPGTEDVPAYFAKVETTGRMRRSHLKIF